jgi:hypothetical protein
MASPVEKALSRSRSLLVDLTLLQKRRRGSNAISERVVQHEMRVRITNFLAFAFLDCAFASILEFRANLTGSRPLPIGGGRCDFAFR